jgi:hypothetical protein
LSIIATNRRSVPRRNSSFEFFRKQRELFQPQVVRAKRGQTATLQRGRIRQPTAPELVTNQRFRREWHVPRKKTKPPMTMGIEEEFFVVEQGTGELAHGGWREIVESEPFGTIDLTPKSIVK